MTEDSKGSDSQYYWGGKSAEYYRYRLWGIIQASIDIRIYRGLFGIIGTQGYLTSFGSNSSSRYLAYTPGFKIGVGIEMESWKIRNRQH